MSALVGYARTSTVEQEAGSRTSGINGNFAYRSASWNDCLDLN